MSLSIPEFVAHWKANQLTERSGSQSHFNEICDLVGHGHPTDVDLTGDSFTFDKHVSKDRKGKGFAARLDARPFWLGV